MNQQRNVYAKTIVQGRSHAGAAFSSAEAIANILLYLDVMEKKIIIQKFFQRHPLAKSQVQQN